MSVRQTVIPDLTRVLQSLISGNLLGSQCLRNDIPKIMDPNLEQLARCLQQTLSAVKQERKEAEDFLVSQERVPGYPLLLLKAVDTEQMPMHLRVSASVTFKNFVKRNWRVVDDIDKIHGSDRTSIKGLIVEFMLNSPDQIQKQLSDAISIIGREDFPAKWPKLLTEMIDKLKSSDYHVINGVLHTAHSIFRRYRHEFKSEELWTEIKFVLDNFAPPFTELFKKTMDLASVHHTDPIALEVIYRSLILICKIFYSLNFQDLPEFFEDNMSIWMPRLHNILLITNTLPSQNEDEPDLLDVARSQVCDIASLYTQKYDEEFSPHVEKFVTAVWHLLLHVGPEVKYDLVVSNAIQFMASVAEKPNHKSLFQEPNILKTCCEKIIVPNMEFRENDMECFEDNPEEYIRRDIEGSDVDTRRRAACDFVKALSKQFEDVVVGNFILYVKNMLMLYSQNPSENWKSKDVAIYLVTSLAAKGQTQKHGVTQTSGLVNASEFFQHHIAPDLAAPDVNDSPVLKADAIKYVMTFRNQLPIQMVIACVPHLVNLLTANSIVVHSYAALTLERIFTIRSPQGGTAITRASIMATEKQLLKNLFAALQLKGSSENEYVMKAIMRTFSLLGEGLVPVIKELIEELTLKLRAVSKNPSKPHFNHYLFESICLAVRTTCKANPAAVSDFEDGLFAPFQDILQEDVQEFIPYVFQIMSLLLEIRTSVPDNYMNLFDLLTVPALWERQGNVPALVRLIQAFIEKGAALIAANKVEGILGVFQKLLSSKTNDHEGFYLINSMIEHMPVEALNPYINQVFILLFRRLTSSKTTKFVKSLVVFFCLYAIRRGASQLIQMIDGLQAKMFGNVVERVIISDVQKVSGQTEKKICAVGITKILTEAPEMLQGDYERLWTPLLQSLIGLFELPEDDSTPDDEHFIEIEETPGYQTAFSQLAFAGKRKFDPVAAVVDPKMELAKHLEKLSSGHPGKLPVMCSTLQPDAATFLQQYLQAAGVNLS